MEYFIGLEAFRFGGLFFLVKRRAENNRKIIRLYVNEIAPYALYLGGYLVWREFIFQSERGATDIGQQLLSFYMAPLKTVVDWFFLLLKDIWNVAFLAWGAPLVRTYAQMNSQELIIAGVVTLFLGMLVALLYYRLKYSEDSREVGDDWRIEALILGFLILICAQIPVIMVNRQVDFVYFSRYALAGSVGLAILLPALVYTIESRAVRVAFVIVLVGIAVFTQHSNTVKAKNETAAWRDFWWQVSWRAPQIKQGTTFLANYALGDITEDYIVWGPASFIYYPYSASEKHISPAFSAILFNDQDAIVNNLIARREEIKYDNRRSIDVYQRFKRVLILSQPSLSSCVHSIDGSQPELSENEDLGLMFLAPYSRIDMILAEGEASQPPPHIFGSVPAHQWCYFYQKALQARQRGEWHKVRALGDEAFQKGFQPADPIEWLPFMQAYALEGNEARLREIVPMVESSTFVKKQACELLMRMNLSRPETKDFIENTYCTEPNP